MTVFFALLVAILTHECGHLLAARLLHIPLVSFAVRASGFSLVFDFSRIDYRREMLVHLAGGAVGVVSFVLFGRADSAFLHSFAEISLAFALVNLLPIRTFDGGAALRAFLSEFCLPDTVWRIGNAVSFLCTVLLWAAVLWATLRVRANFGLTVFALGVLFAEMKEQRFTKR